jgi:hypothetical protein
LTWAAVAVTLESLSSVKVTLAPRLATTPLPVKALAVAA